MIIFDIASGYFSFRLFCRICSGHLGHKSGKAYTAFKSLRFFIIDARDAWMKGLERLVLGQTESRFTGWFSGSAV